MTIPIARSQGNLAAAPQVNPLFAKLEMEFHEAFYDPGTSSQNFDFRLYVTRRAAELGNDVVTSLLSRLPNDIVELYQNKMVGSYELDFFDFVLNYQNNRVLSILGTTGVGKTTFLKHVTFHLQDIIPSLQFYRFIYVDLLALDDMPPSHRDFAELIASAAQQAFMTVMSAEQCEEIVTFLQSPMN